jgi:hypothetical protein
LLDRERAALGDDLVTDLVRATDPDRAHAHALQEMLSTIFQLSSPDTTRPSA